MCCFSSSGLSRICVSRKYVLNLTRSGRAAPRYRNCRATSNLSPIRRTRCKPTVVPAITSRCAALSARPKLSNFDRFTISHNMASCDCCCASSTVLLACSRCHLVSYCSKSCQAKHWKEGGHKELCRNTDLIIKPIIRAAFEGNSTETKRLLTGYSTILADNV